VKRPEQTTSSTHQPRILFLYGSLRARSYSRLLAAEAARIIAEFGAEVRFFNPAGLPLVDSAAADHPKVVELRELSQWSEGQVWSCPERHGAITGVMKTQIDWISFSIGAVGANAYSTSPGGDQSSSAPLQRASNSGMQRCCVCACGEQPLKAGLARVGVLGQRHPSRRRGASRCRSP
jgi:arsenical resistance protein ArsH